LRVVLLAPVGRSVGAVWGTHIRSGDLCQRQSSNSRFVLTQKSERARECGRERGPALSVGAAGEPVMTIAGARDRER
jgi:hypothetical protein